MTDPIDRSRLAPGFWKTKPLSRMSRHEWEALCDGCGKCCLNKLEDEDSGDISLTRVACRLLDLDTCHCSNYANRHSYVPECIVLRPGELERHLSWMPETCAYRLVHEGRPLPDWHPLVSGDPESVHRAGISLRGRMVSESEVAEDDWEDYIIDEPT
ncbi:YcgN family cysteine cluster protein [Pontibaca methylaminivorans]|uniref:YcgN family cysteine cluster protein n=1 Tax=Pontibaca methylaminivorans TaxID=515897 RepID=UPI002FDA37F6